MKPPADSDNRCSNRLPEDLVRIWVRMVLDNLIYQCSLNGAQSEAQTLREARQSIDLLAGRDEGIGTE